MKVLVACEFSGRVREAFRSRGHDAWSCDILPAEDDSRHHIQRPVEEILADGWGLMIAHPPCTYIAFSGIRWNVGNPERQRKHDQALDFVRLLLAAPIERIALENPVGVITRHVRKWDQMVQPWMFGDQETKAACLWLKGLPLLVPDRVVDVREARVHMMPPGPDRWKDRSRTFPGIARAMAEQWG